MRNSTIVPRLLLCLLCAYLAFTVYKMLGDEKDGTLAIQKDDATIEKQRDRWEDIPWRPAAEEDARLKRLDPKDSGYLNTVRGWPSVGGIVVAERVHSVELEFLDLDRFHFTPRSSNATEEDEFCRKLRKIGGKWWTDHGEWEDATLYRVRRMWPEESQALFLGWPKDGGVWVLRFDPWWEPPKSMGRVYNAFTMEERCGAIEMLGGTFYDRPEDCEFVKPLLEGFGDHLRKKDPTEEEGKWDHGM